MSWLKTLRSDVRTNFVGLLMTGIVLILAPVGAAISKAYAKEAIPWTIFILVVCVGIVLVLLAIRLTKKFPVLTEEKQRELQQRKQEALSSGNFDRADRNSDTIWRRVEDVEKSITDDLRIIEIMGHLEVPITREISEAMTNGPSRIEPIEQSLIDQAYEIDHELTWPTFRKMGIAVVNLNLGIAQFNEKADAPLCQRLFRIVEEVRRHIVVIRRERLERS